MLFYTLVAAAPREKLVLQAIYPACIYRHDARRRCCAGFSYARLAERRHDALDGRDLSMARERRTIPVVRRPAAAKDCPLAPPEQASVFARTLHRACLIVGGIEQLAQQL